MLSWRLRKLWSSASGLRSKEKKRPVNVTTYQVRTDESMWWLPTSTARVPGPSALPSARRRSNWSPSRSETNSRCKLLRCTFMKRMHENLCHQSILVLGCPGQRQEDTQSESVIVECLRLFAADDHLQCPCATLTTQVVDVST